MSKDDARAQMAEPAASVFAALGNPRRLDLVSRLSDGEEHSIAALTEDVDLTRQAVTKHLKVLHQAGIVERRRVGRESRFAIRPASLTTATDYLTRISDQWDASIARLRAAVER